MASTSFQPIFDYAETISINRRRKVAQTTSRDGTVKAISLGGQVWEFEVKLPDGPRWTDYRGLIEKMEALDRVTVGDVQLNNAGHAWMTGYQGNSVNSTGFYASVGTGATSITLTTSPTTSSGYKFKAGDLIQIGTTGKVYSVTQDVAYNSNTVYLNRPVMESSGTYNLVVGQNVKWTVLCVNFPKWTLFARDQVSWDGPFVFVESL